MRRESRYIFWTTFTATLFCGVVLFFTVNLFASRAATVDVTADVTAATQCGNGILESGEFCDGSAGVGNCYNNTCKGDCTCPVCGNGSIEAGEACENSSDCSPGYQCNSSCGCQASPPICQGCTVSAWSGQCVNGVEVGVGADSCGNPCGLSRACGSVCGNGIVDSGETCDDGNVQNGDCCSSSCQAELNISNVAVTPSTNSAVVNWSTQCQVTTSALEWGTDTGYTGGSVSGLSGSTYSYTINNLLQSTVYYFRITASAGAQSAQHVGNFQTGGGVEQCDNGIDDDRDGFCDYAGSPCTDGSVAGDNDCVCTADFSCTPGQCVNNVRTVSCVDNAQPRCEEDYEFEEGCNACEGVSCSPTQQLNPSTCECELVLNVCGNGICEPPSETPLTCIADCPVDCLPNWECDPWVPTECPANGVQARNCYDRNACPQPIGQPPTQRTCNDTCPGLTCGIGEQINTEQCTCEEIIPFCGNNICESGESNELCPQDCIALCQPSWTCLHWGPCENGVQKRNCVDQNSCDIETGHPPEVRSCSPNCDVACTPGQRININQCVCENIIPYCGNSICEENEAAWSCPTDCGLPPEFRVSISTCLDGLDNDGDGIADYPGDPGCSAPSDNSELNLEEVLLNVQEFVDGAVLNNPVVEKANEQFAAPAIAVTTAASAFSSFSALNFISYIRYLFTEPFLILFRRKRKRWGIVYNSLTKQPVDLAIVRLYGKANGKLVQSRVTDKQGRYSFLVEPGRYYITVTKPHYVFPTKFLQDQDKDIEYLNLYHGATVEITEGNPDINFNIPLDPTEEYRPSRAIMMRHYFRKAQSVVAFSAMPLAAISLAISPGYFTAGLLALHVLLYFSFRRLSLQKNVKSWGKIFNMVTKEPIGRAIARIYDQKYNKLLETRVTDAKGRYSFLVDNNVYYVTVEKPGFDEFKSDTIDLVGTKKDTIIGKDIPLTPQAVTATEAASVPSVSVTESSAQVRDAMTALEHAIAQHEVEERAVTDEAVGRATVSRRKKGQKEVAHPSAVWRDEQEVDKAFEKKYKLKEVKKVSSVKKAPEAPRSIFG